MTTTEAGQPATKEGIGTRLWGVLKNSLTDEDAIAAARRARLQAGHAAALAARAEVAKAARPPEAEPAPQALTPMAQALLGLVLSKATAYTALTEKLGALEGVVADEPTRYRAAYALIRASRTVAQVVQAIDVLHAQALEAEAARFAAQLQDKERAEIGTRTDERQRLETRIAEAARQAQQLREQAESRIREIEEEAARDRERLLQVSREVDARREELARVQGQFDDAAASVKDELARARTRVLRHLG